MTMDAFDKRLYTESLLENWNTTSFPVGKEKIINDSACEHCEKDPSKMYAIFRESDSFGPVSEYAVCKVCYDKTVSKRKCRGV